MIAGASKMKVRSIAVVATLAAAAACPGLASAQAAAQDNQTITPAFQQALPNVPGKSIVGLVVKYPPGGSTRAHYHPQSSFVTGYVLTGAIRSQVNTGQERVYRAGEHWTEPPGAFHPVSANASKTEPASLLAIIILDTADIDRAVTYGPQ
jgi:quercetin dioxygenase-like cupin family protein